MRRAVVLFPNGLTLANLFFGVLAIVMASRGQFTEAGWCVVCGGIADAFDGRVARVVGAGGRFGEELDSLVDAITFGLAPAMIVYFAVLNKDGWDWVWSFIYIAAAVLRLARFNVAQAGTKKSYFQGLPSPAAGITLATYYWFSQSRLYQDTMVGDWNWQELLRYVMLALAGLMTSRIPYPVVPNLSWRSVQGWFGIAFLVGGLTLLATRQLEYFFPLAVLYIGFGVVRAGLLGLMGRLPDDEDVVEDSIPLEEVALDEEYERDDLVPVAGVRPKRSSLPRGHRAVPLTPPVVPPKSRPAPLPPGSVVGDAGGLDAGLAGSAKRRRRRRRPPRGDRPDGSPPSEPLE